MPNYDSTGPYGEGPRTGRAMGKCGRGAGNGFRGTGLGRGFGRGFNNGRGRLDGNSLLESEMQNLRLKTEAIEEKLNELLQKNS